MIEKLMLAVEIVMYDAFGNACVVRHSLEGQPADAKLAGNLVGRLLKFEPANFSQRGVGQRATAEGSKSGILCPRKDTIWDI